MVKPLFITTLLLTIIGVGLFILNKENNNTNNENSNFTGQKLLDEIDTKALNKINIRGDNSFVSLIQLQGGGWEEKSLKYEADKSSIQDLLLKLSQIKLGDLVTNNSDHHDRFKLVDLPDDDTKWSKDIHGNSVTLLKGDGTIILSLLLGKNRQNGEGQYIRHNGSEKVYLIPESLSVNTNIDDWLNKELLNLDSDLVASIKLKDNSNIILNIYRKNSEAEWKSSKETILPEKVNIQSILDRLSALSFSKLLVRNIGDDNKLNLSEKTLIITLFDGKLFTLKLQNNSDSNGNYLLSLRMGILQVASEKTVTEETNVRKEMELFNKKMNGRLFEISSWEGKDLLINND